MEKKKTVTRGILIGTGVGVILIASLAFHLFNQSDSDQKMVNGLYASGGACVSCHDQVVGLSPSHLQIGCVACHLGDRESTEKTIAHDGMFTIPGNTSNMEQTCGVCHADAVEAIEHSLMSSNSGIVNVNRYVFGQQNTPNGHAHITELTHSTADDHLRNLCSSCHLGNEKEETGVIDQLSRGGGCNACHLNYSDEAIQAHQIYLKSPDTLPSIHPSLDLNISNNHCFGCHSRSGRISTHYEGYHETTLNIADVSSSSKYRILQDERVFEYISADIHHSKGLLCVDCHTYAEVMGDGKSYEHAEDAVKIRCEDCHYSDPPNTLNVDLLEPTYKRIYNLRGYVHKQILRTATDNIPLVNTYVLENDEAFLFGKKDRILHPLKSPVSACSREHGHRDLNCSSCHTSWAAQCISCHVEYNPTSVGYDLLDKTYQKGTWIEYKGEFLAGPPTLGIREEAGKREINPAIPGMVFTLDSTAFKGSSGGETSFHRLFAPASPHTISKTGRDCKSCHNDPVTLGYGRGNLEFVIEDKQAHWEFHPRFDILPHDSLPADAWIGFLKETSSSTRLNFRAFSIEEQKRILTVGACLTCHDQKSKLMQQSIHIDFSQLLEQLDQACRIPDFE